MSRDDKLGKRALFGPPPANLETDPLAGDPLVAKERPEGKAALFSTGPHRPGTVVVECGTCGVHTRIPIVEAGVRIAMLSAWVPPMLKRYNRWVLCPECGRRRWCRIRWTG